eukprot:Seg1320.6 transcript_id=Seg1320.6/GoldUCD/mRNA.D3Y31 product="hypothetical protein" protein_id=Seg1320.6/GoldUCD/D3Y31
MDLSILVFIFLQFILQCTARWYMAVRPVYDLSLGNRTLTLNRTQRTPKRVRITNRQCRKDKQCGKDRFCYRYSGTCHDCRWDGQLCRRNQMCCRGFACVSGICKPIKQFGTEGSVCRKSKDCQAGLCCSKTNAGPRVCRKFLQVGDACGSLEGSPLFKINHFCACDVGLKCKKVRRISNRVRNNPGWLHRKERRCARTT